MDTTYLRLGSPVVRVLRWFRQRSGELSKFGAVGVAGVFVDAGAFNLLILGPFATGDRVILAKILATSVAVVFAWTAHRLWTFRGRGVHRPGRELVLFVAVNGVALAIQAGVLAISYYGLGYTGPVANNVAAYAVGLPLGTAARYLGYKLFVFTGTLSTDTAREVALGAVNPDDAST